MAIAGAALLLVAALRAAPFSEDPAVIRGPLAALLASSTDLGPSHAGDAQLTVTLAASTRPEALIDWAEARDLSVRWRPGDAWGIVEGPPQRVASAFAVPVHDYRARKGQVFYAAAEQPWIPVPLRGSVTGLGRILSYTPHRMASPGLLPLDVPKGG